MKKINTQFIRAFMLLISVFPIFLFGQTISVDAPPYNAVGDGITDDYAAIQSAINDFRNNGGTLEFTSGKTYIISQGLIFNTFPDTHDYLVTSTGTTKATIKIQDAAPLTWLHWGIRLSVSQNVTIRNLAIDGNRDTRNPTIETSGTAVLFIDGASDGTRLENLDLINSPMDNIYIVVHENQGQTVMTDFEMHNCRLENGFRNNMSVISGANFKIIGCQFINANGTDPQTGIDFEPNNSTTTAYSNMTVEGCLFKDNVRYGIELTYIIAGAGTTEVKNNYFENNGILVASKDNLIHHNVFAKQDHQHLHGANTRDGIIYFHTGGTSTGNEVYNNYFYDNPMPAGSHLIKFMSNSGGGNSVHDNFGHGNVVDGFVINNTDPATMPEQTIQNNTFLATKEMGYWNMDAAEITGNAINDLSDFNHDGVITGATSTAGASNEALDFAPDDKFIKISANDNLNIEMNFTVLAWIKWADTNAEPQQVVVGRGDDWRFGVSNTGQIGLYAAAPFTAGWVQSPANAITANQWKMVTATYDGRNAKIYVDGQEVASEQANGALGTALANLYIGSLGGNTYSFNGVIDDVRIYNYSLSQVELQAIFDAAPLPVTWTSPLTAIQQDGGSLLTWVVAQQLNNEKFIVERSNDAIHFQPIGEIAGDGNSLIKSTFRIMDTTPFKGNNYYRIAQVDFDGTVTYSNIAYLYFNDDRTFAIYPNPTHNRLSLQTDIRFDYLEIYDNAGIRVMTLKPGIHEIDVHLLQNGVYTIRATTANRTFYRRFVKN